MTICIAGIATRASGEEVHIISTDHMLSFGTIGQFESSITKYKKINKNTVAMLSGNPLIFDKLLEGTEKLETFDKIKDAIYEKMVILKKDMIQKEILNKYQIDYAYIQEVLKSKLENNYVRSLIKNVTNFTLETVILLTGYKNSKAQIVNINEYGVDDLRDISICAIGTGTPQAINTLLFQRHSRTDNITTAIYNVYKAKRNAEVAVGVGKETDMLVLTESKIYDLTGAQINTLSEIYEDELKYGKAHRLVAGIFLNLIGE